MIEHCDFSLYLLDGEVKGRICIQIDDYPLVVYKIPRGSFKKDTRECDYIDNSSIYFLFGEHEGSRTVYVGQAATRKDGKGALRRILEPHSDKVWKSALIVTTNDNRLTTSWLKYLENHFYNLAKSANNYVLTTRVEPTTDYSISSKDVRMLKKMSKHICAIVELLGYKVFVRTTETKKTDPPIPNPLPNIEKNTLPKKVTEGVLVKRQNTPKTPVNSIKERIEKEKTQNYKGPLFYCRRRSADAKGYRLHGKQFVLLRGSRLSPEEPNSYYLTTFNNRLEEFKDKLDGNLVLEDIVFETPSAASGFVLKTSSSGNADWRTKKGIKLGEYQQNKKDNTEDIVESPSESLFAKEEDGNVIYYKDNATNAPRSPLATVLFFCDQRGSDAKGYYNPESGTFTVLKGSRITPNPFADHVVNNEKNWREMRNLCEKYGRFLESDGMTFATDATFDKPSTSARFIMKSVVNGKMAWHDENGNSLKSYLDE